MTAFGEHHVRWCLSLINQDPTDWQTIEANLSQIHAAWDWTTAQPGHEVHVLELVWALQPFIEQRTSLDEQLRWYSRALHSAEVLDLPEDEAWLHHHIGQVCRTQGDVDGALAAYNDALALWSRLGERASIAATLNNLGLVLQDRRELDAAMTCFERALSIHRVLGNRTEESTTLHNIANLYDAMGEPDLALNTYESALAIAREEHDAAGEATTLYQMCVLDHDRGEFSAVVERLDSVLELVRQLGDLRGEAIAESLLGDACDGLHDWARAADAHERAVAIWRSLGERGQQARASQDVGWSRYMQGDRDAAERAYVAARDIRRELQDPSGEAAALHNLIGIYEARGDLAGAVELIDEVLALNEAFGESSDGDREFYDAIRARLRTAQD